MDLRHPASAPDLLAAYVAAGEALGILHGRRAVEDAAFHRAYLEAVHAQLIAAEVCKCVDGDDHDLGPDERFWPTGTLRLVHPPKN